MSEVLNPGTLPSVSQHTPMDLWDVLFIYLIEEEETASWFTDDSSCYASTTGE